MVLCPLHVKKQVFYNLQTDLGTWIPNTASGECGVKLSTEKIIGGDKALFGEFPYMALLGSVTSVVEFCGRESTGSRF